VPEPSVPSPFAVWAEYIAADADGVRQRREARQVFRPLQCSRESFCFSAFAPRSAGVKVQLYRIADRSSGNARIRAVAAAATSTIGLHDLEGPSKLTTSSGSTRFCDNANGRWVGELHLSPRRKARQACMGPEARARELEP
jgi:hypothetical protein